MKVGGDRGVGEGAERDHVSAKSLGDNGVGVGAGGRLSRTADAILFLARQFWCSLLQIVTEGKDIVSIVIF